MRKPKMPIRKPPRRPTAARQRALCRDESNVAANRWRAGGLLPCPRRQILTAASRPGRGGDIPQP